ncbi:protein tipE isoform X1 [Toxorhynchites rutilus septentrionalis]|uniref:protein tipE isoform X1 n=1 Tax=Toxorhynchites rutilus septentrionalis TaxID=329112 RepID=UPI002478FC50|nr:protein tipE isoform X1 [Toxorhynchites rutilus septentrionalis]
MRSNELRSSSSTLSAAPSLVTMSKASINNSKTSLTHSRQSVAESSKEPKPPTREEIISELLDKAKFYASLCLGTTAILSVFAFLFLIPFVVDPAISTIVADYDPVPVTCVVTDHVCAEGMRNCTWSSCREGCTTAAVKCHQLLVNYTKIPYHDWQKHPRDLNSVEWDVMDTKFLVNTEGCGYPPRVNCTEFAKKYGYSHVGDPFPCYYSRAYPEMVVARYSWDDNLKHLILSLIIPNVLFAVSIGVLSYWYCPCCDKACHKSPRVYAEKYPTKEKKESWSIDRPEDYISKI